MCLIVAYNFFASLGVSCSFSFSAGVVVRFRFCLCLVPSWSLLAKAVISCVSVSDLVRLRHRQYSSDVQLRHRLYPLRLGLSSGPSRPSSIGAHNKRHAALVLRGEAVATHYTLASGAGAPLSFFVGVHVSTNLSKNVHHDVNEEYISYKCWLTCHRTRTRTNTIPNGT
jgi:hypothetical protein